MAAVYASGRHPQIPRSRGRLCPARARAGAAGGTADVLEDQRKGIL